MNTLESLLLGWRELPENSRTHAHSPTCLHNRSVKRLTTAATQVLLAFLLSRAQAGEIFVSNFRGGTIGEYDAVTGATINSALVTGLFVPRFIATSGGDLFVSDNNGTIGVYDAATGAPIDPTLISTPGPRGMVFVGENLLVADVAEN